MGLVRWQSRAGRASGFGTGTEAARQPHADYWVESLGAGAGELLHRANLSRVEDAGIRVLTSAENDSTNSRRRSLRRVGECMQGRRPRRREFRLLLAPY